MTAEMTLNLSLIQLFIKHRLFHKIMIALYSLFFKQRGRGNLAPTRLLSILFYKLACIGYSIGMNERWVTLRITYDPLEAEMIEDLLESGGIPVVLRSAKVSPYPVNVGRMGEVTILVKEEDRETAEKALTEESYE
ncbi:MAG TPA: DUF2007 domain-containing protein [Nitrospirae bacterium]|nr:DUF2007 domain-containing protein [Nitrospirota bacterium]